MQVRAGDHLERAPRSGPRRGARRRRRRRPRAGPRRSRSGRRARTSRGATRSSGSYEVARAAAPRGLRAARAQHGPDRRPPAPVISTRSMAAWRVCTHSGKSRRRLRAITTGERRRGRPTMRRDGRRTSHPDHPPPPRPLARRRVRRPGARAGACPPARVRLGFVLGASVLGLGVLVYVAAWLILPAESEDGSRPARHRAAGPGLRRAARPRDAGGAPAPWRRCSASAGWSSRSPARCSSARSRAGPGSARPGRCCRSARSCCRSAALAVGGRARRPEHAGGDASRRARSPSCARATRAASACSPLDLRRTALPESGTVPLRIEAGVRRTLVALPHDRCVHVEVDQRDPPLALRVGAALLGEGNLGHARAADRVRPVRRADRRGSRAAHRTQTARPGPTLDDRLLHDGRRARRARLSRTTSTRARTRTGPATPSIPRSARHDRARRAEATRLVREWRARREEQDVDKERIDALMAGPCASRRSGDEEKLAEAPDERARRSRRAHHRRRGRAARRRAGASRSATAATRCRSRCSARAPCSALFVLVPRAIAADPPAPRAARRRRARRGAVRADRLLRLLRRRPRPVGAAGARLRRCCRSRSSRSRRSAA